MSSSNQPHIPGASACRRRAAAKAEPSGVIDASSASEKNDSSSSSSSSSEEGASWSESPSRSARTPSSSERSVSPPATAASYRACEPPPEMPGDVHPVGAHEVGNRRHVRGAVRNHAALVPLRLRIAGPRAADEPQLARRGSLDPAREQHSAPRRAVAHHNRHSVGIPRGEDLELPSVRQPQELGICLPRQRSVAKGSPVRIRRGPATVTG
jgi:hypothetical protein